MRSEQVSHSSPQNLFRWLVGCYWLPPQERRRFVRFAIVGAVGAVVDFIVMNLLVKVFLLSLVLAGTISFITAASSNFTWNRYWTYPDSRSKPVMQQWLEFLIINAMGLLIRVPILALLDPPLRSLFGLAATNLHLSGLGPLWQSPFFNPYTLADNFTLAIAIVIVMFWNFFANRYWTYNDVKA